MCNVAAVDDVVCKDRGLLGAAAAAADVDDDDDVVKVVVVGPTTSATLQDGYAMIWC